MSKVDKFEELTRSDLKIFLMFGLHLAMADKDFSMSEKRLLGRFYKKLRLSEKEQLEISGKPISLAKNMDGLSSDAVRERLVEFLCAVSSVDGDPPQ